MLHNTKSESGITLKVARKAFLHIYVLASLAILTTVVLYFMGRSTPVWMWAVSIIVFIMGVKMPEVERFTTSYTINADAIVIQTGIFSKRRQYISMNNIIDVTLDQTVWQRMINYGDLSVHTFNDDTINIGSIDNPKHAIPIIEKFISRRDTKEESKKVKHNARTTR